MGNFAKLNDERVHEFIRWAQAQSRFIWWQNGKTDPSMAEVNYGAWQCLKVQIRGDKHHRYDQDFDAAAAEHYMFIRFLAGQTGDPTCHVAPTLYGVKKVLDQLLGRLQLGQAQEGHPVLPANPYIVAWGQSGVVDGLADFKAASSGADYKIGSAVADLAGFVIKSKPVVEKIGEYAVKSGNTLPGYVK